MYGCLSCVLCAHGACLSPQIEQIRFVCEEGPGMIRKAFEVSADGSFVWREDNPMYPVTVDETRAEMRSAALAQSVSLSSAPSPSLEFQARYLMWNMIRDKYDGEQRLRARAGLELPSRPHMKKWNAYKKGKPVNARDMLEHHYRLIR